MSYHYGSYQPEAHHQASLPRNLPRNLPPRLYRGPQDIYYHNAPGMNSGLQMVPQPQNSNMQHTVYHSVPHSVRYSSQHPQPQYASRHVDHRLGFDTTNRPQRDVYLPPQFPQRNHAGSQPQLQLGQSASYASTGPYDSVPGFGLRNSNPTGLGFGRNNVAPPLPSNSRRRQAQSPPDTNVLDGLPPLKRIQGRHAHMNAIPRWEPQKAQPVKPRLHPQFSLSTQPKGSIKGSNRDWSTLQPGAIHTLIPVISFASSSPLDEYLQHAATHRDSVIYLPRCVDFSGKDKDPRACVSFSVDGMPGPYLLDLAEARVIIDGEDDKIFEQFGWRSTKFQIDWPGLSLPAEGLKVFNKDGLPLRRGELAALVATSIVKMIINTQRGYALPMGETQKLSESAKYWDIMKVDCNHLRLISVNHYGKVWVPVLALDIAAYNM